MKIYEDIEAERDRIQKCIQKFGWTSDHNLDWFTCCTLRPEGKSTFAEFEDGTGILFHIYPDEWQTWSNPLCDKKIGAEKVEEFLSFTFKEGISRVWCNYISDDIHPTLLSNKKFNINPIDYSLDWPVLSMDKFDPTLPGGHFKDMRNARSKFNREHEIQTVDYEEKYNEVLHGIVEAWKKVALTKEESKYVYDSWYHNLINNSFRGFKTTRILFIDNRAVGFNAGYEVPNNPGRFGGAVGIHDYSIKELGLMLWLEDLEWIKKAGYKEIDMQGDEGHKIKSKMQFGPVIERRTDTFSVQAK